MVARRAGLTTTMPLGLIIALLGAWVVFVPLLGPYFGFGFESDDAWATSRVYWLLSLIPGAAAFAGGLNMGTPWRAPTWLGGLLALLAGLWLVLGPSLYPAFSAGDVSPAASSEWKTALLWIGYFYGPGALILFLSGLAEGLSWHRPAVVRRDVTDPELSERPSSRPMAYPY